MFTRQHTPKAFNSRARGWSTSERRELWTYPGYVMPSLVFYAEGRQTAVPMKHDSDVIAIHMSADGRRIVTASHDHSARIWDAATSESIGEPMLHDGAIFAMSLSNDELMCVTGSADKTARLWDAHTGKSLREPLQHDGLVSDVGRTCRLSSRWPINCHGIRRSLRTYLERRRIKSYSPRPASR